MRPDYDKLQILNDIDLSRAVAFSGYRVEKIVRLGYVDWGCILFVIHKIIRMFGPLSLQQT